MSLDKFRKKIDALDEQLTRLLNKRADVVHRIGKAKSKIAAECFVPERAKKVYDHVCQVNKGPLTSRALRAIYREIMSVSLSMEKKTRVAYLGPPATFTHQAARGCFGGSVTYVPCETIHEVFSSIRKELADYGVVPIENSSEGAVGHTLDEFADSPLKICAEIYLHVVQHLMSKTPRAKIKRILSKAEVFGQCRNWLYTQMRGAEQISVASTAKAAELAAKGRHSAAIASSLAAEIYGLQIVASDVQDLGENTTRFLVISRQYGRATGDDKTSIYFTVRNRVGALHQALASFKKHGVNLLRIESRPSRIKAWEYVFFVDLQGHVADKRVRLALADLGKHCVFITVLGAYPRAMEVL